MCFIALEQWRDHLYSHEKMINYMLLKVWKSSEKIAEREPHHTIWQLFFKIT